MGSAAHRRALRRRRFALLALVGMLLCGQMYVLAYKGVNYGLDLGPVWVSAENFLRHRPIYAGDVETITFSFLPPSGALLTSPLGLMSFDVAAKAFLVVQILVLAVTTGFFVRRFSGPQWLPALVGGAVGLALSMPFIYTLRFGSVNGVLVGAMLAFFVGAADGRRWTGLLLGASLALKPVLWPLVAVLFLRRQYRQAAAAVSVSGGLLVAATALARDGTDYLTKVLPYLARGEPGLERFNVSILGLTQQAGWPGTWAVLGRVALAGAGVALCVRLWRREPNDFDLVEVGTALVLAGVVVSSWATFYYAAFAFPALLLFHDRRSAASSLLLWPFVLAVGVPITFGSDLVTNTRTLGGMLGIVFVVGLRAWRGDPADSISMAGAATRRRERIRPSRRKAHALTARRTLASAASLFLVSLGVVGVAGPAQAAHVSCGQTILVSTVLDSNIGPCGAGLVIAANNITLDLNGFTITGGPVSDGPGILLDRVTGVTVKNGTVTQFDAGVAIDGGSANTVTAMRVLDNRGTTSTDFGDGIIMFASDSNRITNNQVRNNGPYDGIGMLASNFNFIDSNQIADNLQSSVNTSGIRVENVGRSASNDNVITNNLVSNNALDGIEVFAGGSRNQIRFNQVFGNARDGITVFAGGNDNIIEGNQIRSNREDGIHIRGAAGAFPGPTGNQILRNVAFGNTVFDLRDNQANCDGNQWHGNQAATFTPPCTINP